MGYGALSPCVLCLLAPVFFFGWREGFGVCEREFVLGRKRARIQKEERGRVTEQEKV